MVKKDDKKVTDDEKKVTMKDILEKEPDELKELPGDRFIYESGKGFASIDPEPSAEEVQEEIKDRKKLGVCLRCEGTDFLTDERGNVFCRGCGQKKL